MGIGLHLVFSSFSIPSLNFKKVDLSVLNGVGKVAYAGNHRRKGLKILCAKILLQFLNPKSNILYCAAAFRGIATLGAIDLLIAFVPLSM